MRWVVRVLAALGVFAASMGNAQAPIVKVALVIANGAYEAVPALTNPERDGALVADALGKVGFDVSPLARDLDKTRFDAALRDFKRKADAADIALIYYAGHGIELEEKNWLLPIDVRLGDPADAHTEGVALETVLRYVQGARRLRVVVLDACRNNPFALRLASPTRALSRGLRPVEGLPAGTLLAYSASFGQEASDGPGLPNSPFASALAKRISEPGLEVSFVFRAIRDDVIAANADSPAAAIRNQRPWLGVELGSEQIFFVEPRAAANLRASGRVSPFLRSLDREALINYMRRSPSQQGPALASFADALLANRGLLTESGIDSPMRLAHFLGQIAVETGGFRMIRAAGVDEESLNYSAERLMMVWPGRFPTLVSAHPYARNPEKTANFVYAGKAGNGDEASGDGWRYRGRGILPVFGKAAYRRTSELIDVDLVANPELLRSHEIAIAAAAATWFELNLNVYAEADNSAAVSRGVNIGDPRSTRFAHAEHERAAWTIRAKQLLGVAPQAEPSVPADGAAAPPH